MLKSLGFLSVQNIIPTAKTTDLQTGEVMVRSNRVGSRLTIQSDSGNVLMEFLVVIPLLIIFFVGLTEFGRVFSSMTWVSQSTYLAAMRSSELPASMGELAAQNKYIELHGIQNKALSEPSHDNVEVTYSSDDRTVQVAVSNELVPILGEMGSHFLGTALNINFSDDYVAPILIADPDSIPGAKDSFGGAEPGCWYDCDFVKHCGGNPPDTILCDAPDNSPPPTHGGGGGGCFKAGTPISLEDGTTLPIELIKVGDRVLSWSEEEHTIVSSAVIDTMTFEQDHHYILNGFIKVTAEHPFYVDGRWVKVEDLEVGDQLQSVTDESIRLDSVEYVAEPTTVFNFTVAGTHNYYAAGILVHNKSDVMDFGIPGEGGP